MKIKGIGEFRYPFTGIEYLGNTAKPFSLRLVYNCL